MHTAEGAEGYASPSTVGDGTFVVGAKGPSSTCPPPVVTVIIVVVPALSSTSTVILPIATVSMTVPGISDRPSRVERRATWVALTVSSARRTISAINGFIVRGLVIATLHHPRQSLRIIVGGILSWGTGIAAMNERRKRQNTSSVWMPDGVVFREGRLVRAGNHFFIFWLVRAGHHFFIFCQLCLDDCIAQVLIRLFGVTFLLIAIHSSSLCHLAIIAEDLLQFVKRDEEILLATTQFGLDVLP
jgi:hypothetical protein